MRKKTWGSLIAVIVAGMLMMNSLYGDIAYASSDGSYQETIKELSKDREINTNGISENKTKIDKMETRAPDNTIDPFMDEEPRHTETTENVVSEDDASTIAEGSPSENEDEYKIITDSKELGDVGDNHYESKFYLGPFPTDGKILFKNVNSQSWDQTTFCLDREGPFMPEGVIEDVSEFSGEISKGSHYIYLTSIQPINASTTVSYTFYPKCRVYCIYGDQYEEIASYYLQESYSGLKLSAPSIKGYRVLGLYSDRSLTTPIESVGKNIGNDWYIYPKVEPITYSVAYDLDGGENHPNNPQSITVEDGKFCLGPATKKGYRFDGWYSEPIFKTKVEEIDPSLCKNLVVYAKWEEEEYNIAYEDAHTHTNPSIYTASDITIRLKDPDQKGYRFEGWFTDAEYQDSITEIDCSRAEDIILYAKWFPLTYSIKYGLNGGINHGANPDTYTVEDNDILLGEPTREGYSFEGWYSTSTFKTEVTEIKVSDCKDITVYAKWKRAPVTPTPSTVPIPTDDPTVTPVPTESVTPTVTEIPKLKYTITYRNMDEATNPNPADYTEGDTAIRLKDPSKPMHTFSGWYTTVGFDAGTKVDSVDTSLCKDVILYAKWTENTYTEGVYKIEKISARLGERGNGILPSELTMDFPRDGRVYFSNELSEKCHSASFTLDEEFYPGSYEGILPTEKISDLSRILSAGQHHLYCYSIGMAASGSAQEKYTTVSYSYHPLIDIYYVIQGHPYKYADYYMEDSPTQTKLPMPVLEGYEIEGIYCDAEHTIPMEYYDKSIGQDLYIYPKIKSDEDMTDPSEEEYKIITDSKEIGFNERFYLGPFPTDGKIIFKDVDVDDYAVQSYSLDYDGGIIGGADRYEEYASAFSGDISKGEHFLCLSDIMPVTWTNIVSYTFYPKCRVYCIYKDQTTEIANYYLGESYSRLTLKAPDIKGYRVLGLYSDRALTVPAGSVSKGIGRDWYVYPKVEPLTYSVTYDLDGGVNNSKNKESYTIEDEDIILQSPTKKGYIFEGWYSTPALKTKVTKIKSDACKNIKIYAKWGKDKKTWTLDVTPSDFTLYAGGRSKTLRVSNAKGRVTYRSSDTRIAKVNSNGTVTPVSRGNATITVQATGNDFYSVATKKINVVVYGKPTKVKSIEAAPARAKRTVKVSWGKMTSVSGYIIRYSYKKNMSGSKNINVSGRNTRSRTLKKLKSKKYLYIQVQAYIRDGDRLVKGPWSKVTRSKGKIK